MRPSAEPLLEVRRIQSRAPVIPGQCYEACSTLIMITIRLVLIVCLDNASIEAQRIGKSPEICSPDTPFWYYYQACSKCLEANSGGDGDSDDTAEPTETFLNDTFGPYIEYCGSVPVQTPVQTSTQTSAQTSALSTLSTGTRTSSLVGYTVVITIPYTATNDGLRTVWSLEKTLTSYPPVPKTTIITIRTSENGHSTVWEFTRTFTPLPTEELVPMPHNTTSSIVPPTPQIPDGT